MNDSSAGTLPSSFGYEGAKAIRRRLPDSAPTLLDIEAAAERLKGYTWTTPLLRSDRLDTLLGHRIVFKPECLQYTGSFKIRGASNKILRALQGPQPPRTVVAFSSGNHGFAVATAASRHGLKAFIVMPKDAPAIKIQNTRATGAEIVLYDRVAEDREAVAKELQERHNALLVPPFDDADIIAGQATAAFEMIRQAAAFDIQFDAFAVPCSGGGLAAGCALAFHYCSPKTAIYAVEPEHYDDLGRSLAAGKRVQNTGNPPSLCDALLAPTPGVIPFGIHEALLTGAVTVSDRECLHAMKTAFEHLKVVIEPGGAAAFAALLQNRLPASAKTVGILLSGGNVDAATYRKALSED